MRPTFIEAHISDIHFGALDPKVQYDILCEQFLNPISQIPLNIVSVNGDLFHSKVLANSSVIVYACKFIEDLVQLCRSKDATLILIEGTESHDAQQLRLFHHYINEGVCDIRIIHTGQFINVKGKEILILPEEYNKGQDYYLSLFRDREYDACYMHGTFINSIPKKNFEDLNSNREPTFSMNNFWRCKGPIIAGHVHTAQCLNGHFYYCGSPIRWCFGEEQPKGFFVLVHNLETCQYYMHFQQIQSFRYDTVDLDDLLTTDPHEVAKYIDNLKASGVDYIKLKVKKFCDTLPIIREYYHDKNWLKIDDQSRKEVIDKANQEALQKYNGLEFLMDPNIDDTKKFVMYVNHFEGEGFISVDELNRILHDPKW